MAFVYNNKLPFFSWGVMASGTLGKTHSLYQLKADSGGLVVPTPENGAQKLWVWRTTNAVNSVSSSAPSGLEATPCDAQMPWHSFVYSAAVPATGYGLTLHGEIYSFEAASDYYGDAEKTFSRRLERVTSTDCQTPFSSLNYADALLTTDYVYRAISTSSDGKCWWIRRSRDAYKFNIHSLEEIAAPSGKKAVAAWRKSNPDIIVLNTDEDRTYIKARTSSTWYCLTSGVYKNSGWNPFDHLWLTSDLPTVAVQNAPAGGVNATVSATWQAFDPQYSYLQKLEITNTGSGYSSDPPVVFGREPDAKTSDGTAFGSIDTPGIATSITMTVFSDKITQLLSQPSRQNSQNEWLADSGNVWALPLVNATNDVWAISKNADYQTSAGAQLLLKDKAIASSYVLTVSGAVYKFASGSYSLIDSGPFVSMASADNVVALVKNDGGLYTFGTNGNTARRNTYGALFGDLTEVGTVRAAPAQIASEADWVSVWGFVDGFAAVRKDAICRSIGQQMEYWPDWYYQSHT